MFAAGHAETGNDIPLLLSTSKAERVDGGYKFTGRKAFGSLTPVWTRLGVHGMDTSDPSGAEDRPRVPAARHGGHHDQGNVGRARHARDTQRRHRARRRVLSRQATSRASCRPGAAGMDDFVLGIFAWALLNFGNVYYGLALRVRDLIVEQVKSKSSLALTRSMAYHPDVQHGIAEIAMELEAIGPQLDAATRDWSEGVDHGGTGRSRSSSAKYRAVEGAWRDRRPRARSVGRVRHVQEERAGAAVPRRARRTLPSGQLAARRTSSSAS